ncbi:pseudaminic acid synthase [Azonexus sp. IMCC34839]|uniref:pseudaminic acid synthase n=1 Tax=Azonexus sp. IMCC34839 TaxID=3133695 RepID=UPI003999A0BA
MNEYATTLPEPPPKKQGDHRIETRFTITGRPIGRDAPPFVIAEMSGNHNQSLERALAIVEAVAAAGAHALKIQTYTADTMTLDCNRGEFFIDDPNSLWQGKSLYRLYQEAHTPWAWHGPIFARALELGLIPFSTPFDESAVDFLETLDVPCYKIASFENTDLPLIRKVAKTGKPMIISTGMASVAELDEAVRTARAAGCHHLVLLKCTSTYPATPADTNLRTIPHLRELFGCEVGLSDHTMGVGAAVASVALGATVIEKHFTLSRADGGVDSVFSLEPDEMRALVVESETAWQALGTVNYGASKAEENSKVFRRSIYACRNIAAGEPLTPENIRIIRPGFGLPPCYYDICVGHTAHVPIARGTPIDWSLLA